jgi:hypothetical protein
MDEEKRSDRGQRRKTGGVSLKGATSGYQHLPDEKSKLNQGSHSKLNRILCNLERSFLSQFNSNLNEKRRCESTQKQPTTSKDKAKTKPVDVASNAAVKTRSGEDKDNGCKSVKHQTSHQKQEHPANADKITSSLKTSSAVKSASERLGKLTLNSKIQQNKSPQQQQQSFSSPMHHKMNTLITNKLPVPPPPHAHSEARSINHSFLFGNGSPHTMLNTAQRSLFDTTRGDVRASCSTLRQESGTSNKMRNDNLLGEAHANRLNSSPASSAKSLPAIAPKPGSQPSNQSNKAIQDDEEESGFATYQSRRALNSNHQQMQHQQQMDVLRATGGEQNNVMMYHPNNQSSNFYTVTQSHNPMTGHQLHDNHNKPNMALHMDQNNNAHVVLKFVVPQVNPRQCTQPPMVTRNEQLMIGDPSNNLRYHSYNQPSQINNIPFPQFRHTQLLQQNMSYQQSEYFDNRLVAHRGTNQPVPSDNAQQIYANAPPKPRRYQYYDSMANQNPAPINQVMGLNMTMMPAQRHSATVVRAIPNQQAPYNQNQIVMPPFSYQPANAGGHSLNAPLRTSLSNPNRDIVLRSNMPMTSVNNMQMHQSFQNSSACQPMGFPLVKSKSSLDAGDVLRFRQGLQTNGQVNNQSNFQPQFKQPVYGYQNDGSFHRNLNQPFMHTVVSHERPHPTIIGSNLQRSKSVTHLLPEIEEPIHQNRAHAMTRNMSSITSASTNQLNDIGANHVVNLPLNVDSIDNRLYNQQLQRARLPAHLNQGINYCVGNNLLAQNFTTNSISNQSQFQRAKSMAALNTEPTFSNKLIRCSPGNISHELRGSNKLSLGDQIKHLLIGGADNVSAQAFAASNQDANANIYQTSEHNRSFGLAPSSSDASNFTQPPRTWHEVNSNCVMPSARAQQQLHQNENSMAPSSTLLALGSEKFTTAGNYSNANIYSNYPTSQLLELKGQNSASSLSLAAVNEFSDMGNRQQRNYQVRQNEPDLRNRVLNFTRPQNDTNSHLIVDLTTPKVLATTQTNLQSTNNAVENSSDSWSINQVGLPQMSSKAPQVLKSATIQNNDSQVNSTTDCNTSERHGNNGSNVDQKESPTSDKPNSDQTKDAMSSLERTAPYYYSDLKSEEQRRALMSIVQQKSLSPPPQLLSRSTDQSATRLTSRSATMHSSYAKSLSDSLAQRRVQSDKPESKNVQNSSTATDMKDLSQSNDGSLRDDDDFIEFLSNDSSSHRSTFEASQFSSSDFNTSTSASESSNSSGAIGDSLNSICKKSPLNGSQSKSDGSNRPSTIGILKSNYRRFSYDGSESKNACTIDGQESKHADDGKVKSQPSGSDRDRLKEIEEFENVLGNVIDVDSCSVNTLSRSPPISSHQTTCSN